MPACKILVVKITCFKLLLAAIVPFGLFAQRAAPPPPDTTQKIVAGRNNSLQQQTKPYVILISADGFRWDLADIYHATNLLALRDGGVAAKSMRPSYPSLTFPNHYSIATGLYPAHHGLVDNSFTTRKKNRDTALAARRLLTAAGMVARLFGYWQKSSK